MMVFVVGVLCVRFGRMGAGPGDVFEHLFCWCLIFYFLCLVEYIEMKLDCPRLNKKILLTAET